MNKNNNLIVALVFLVILVLVGIILISSYNFKLNKISGNLVIQKSSYNVYIDKIPSYIDINLLKSIDDSLNYWEEKEGIKFVIVSNEKDADFSIKWVREFNGDVLGHTDRGRVVEIGLGDSNCLEDWKEYSQSSVTRIIEHEIGHVLGYQHSEDKNNIMYPEIRPKYDNEINIINESVDPGYAKYYGLCSRYVQGSYTINLFSSDDNLKVYVGNKEELDKLQNGEKIRSLKEFCHPYDGENFDRCLFINDNLVILLNPTKEPIEFSLSVKQN